MNKMEYHEIGEEFLYKGQKLIVRPYYKDSCYKCYFHSDRMFRFCDLENKCRKHERKDENDVYYELVSNRSHDKNTNDSIKNDRLDDKLRWELLPLEDVEDIVRVYTAGAKKYGENKWQDLPDGIRRYKAALLRHLVEYDKGNEMDEETGSRHLAAVAWNAIAMLHISKQKQQ